MTTDMAPGVKSTGRATATPSLAREIVTPVTAVLFLVSTVTGVMLLVHWNAGLARASHEWLSLVFSGIAVWHLARNWRPFVGYVRRRLPLAALILSLAASLVFTGMTASPGGVSPGAVFHTVSEASLDAAAPAFGLTLDEARAILRAAGIEGGPDETLRVIGDRAGLSGPAVMTLLAARTAPEEDGRM
jgi:hypothetical protein